MPTYIALVRAVNVGGTGKLPMSELKKMCEAAGFTKVRTYIASGNVIFQSPKSEGQVKKALKARVEAYIGKPVVVIVRTAAEMAAVASRNPFPKSFWQSSTRDLPRRRAARGLLDASHRKQN